MIVGILLEKVHCNRMNEKPPFLMTCCNSQLWKKLFRQPITCTMVNYILNKKTTRQLTILLSVSFSS